jgi:predicted enzyme related to lactoylglutathione lyase
MPNHIVWVDIPVVKLDRAIRFYTAVLGAEVEKVEYPGMSIGSFPHKDGEAAGCLYVSETVKPSVDGPLVYLNVHGRIDEAVEAAKTSGGKVVQAKESIGPFGFRTVIIDTEGNRIALHSI